MTCYFCISKFIGSSPPPLSGGDAFFNACKGFCFLIRLNTTGIGLLSVFIEKTGNISFTDRDRELNHQSDRRILRHSVIL